MENTGTSLEKLDLEELKRRVQEREMWLKKVIEFVEEVVKEIGTVVKRNVCSDHTSMEWELKNFSGFQFIHSSGHSYCGGSDISIKYIGSASENLEVLKLSYNDTINVIVWEKDFKWRYELNRAMDLKDECIKRWRKDDKVNKELIIKMSQEGNLRRELLEKARNLKID